MQVVLLLLYVLSFGVTVSALQLGDYFTSSPSFNGHLNGDQSSYTLREIRIDIAPSTFQWVLLGFTRPCSITIDNTPSYNCQLAIQGHTGKYTPFPKKRYEVKFNTKDGVEHALNLRSTYLDPSYVREKLFHDVVRALNGTAIHLSHARIYMNGEYNGLYGVVENINSEFMLDNVDGMDVTKLYYNNMPSFYIAAVEVEIEIEGDGEIEIEGITYRICI